MYTTKDQGLNSMMHHGILTLFTQFSFSLGLGIFWYMTSSSLFFAAALNSILFAICGTLVIVVWKKSPEKKANMDKETLSTLFHAVTHTLVAFVLIFTSMHQIFANPQPSNSTLGTILMIIGSLVNGGLYMNQTYDRHHAAMISNGTLILSLQMALGFIGLLLYRYSQTTWPDSSFLLLLGFATLYQARLLLLEGSQKRSLEMLQGLTVPLGEDYCELEDVDHIYKTKTVFM